MLELHTEIEINASAERVWSILLDFSRYPDWNPFIRKVIGEPARGSKLTIRVQPSGAKAMTFRPTVLEVEPRQELRWIGRLLVPGIFDGEHAFVINELDGERVRFVHEERFRGLLVPFFRVSLDRDTRRGFEEMNAALKRRAEQAESAF